MPVGVHLDHCNDPDEIDACIGLGYSSVMIDGSQLAFEDNVALTRAGGRARARAGVWVEAELGALAGDEDSSGDAETGAMTDPARPPSSPSAPASTRSPWRSATSTGSRRSRCGWISSACARSPPSAGRRWCSTAPPGCPTEDLLGAVAAGVVKVNVNAELRRAHLDALAPASPRSATTSARSSGARSRR